MGSSAACERDFSQAGDIMRRERSTMLAQHLEMHCFIKENVGLLPRKLDATPKLSHAEDSSVRDAMSVGVQMSESESSSDGLESDD